MELITSVVAFAGMVILKLPSAPVWVEVRVPFTVTVTPAIGVAFLDSVTLPETIFCAIAATENRVNAMVNAIVSENFMKIFFISIIF